MQIPQAVIHKLNLLIKKKQQLDRSRPLPLELVKNLEDWFRVELTYSSNAIEGNTLSRIETAEVIEKGVAAVISGKPLKDLLEARNHAMALDFIKTLAKKIKSHQYITEQEIKDIHRIILSGIDNRMAGVYRQTDVYIKGTDVEFPSPNRVLHLMKDFTHWLARQQEAHPVMIAADTHYKFVTIHPFVDGNGRTGRLLMNLVLLINGFPMAIIRNEDRTKYLATFDTAGKKNNMLPFYELILKAVEASLDAYLNATEGKEVMTVLMPKKPEKTQLLKIGELSKTTNETIHTIRYWTKEGLLIVKEFTRGGYQLYEPSMIERAKEIRRLQNEQRLTLTEIKEQLHS